MRTTQLETVPEIYGRDDDPSSTVCEIESRQPRYREGVVLL
jgi:hypothetical protein